MESYVKFKGTVKKAASFCNGVLKKGDWDILWVFSLFALYFLVAYMTIFKTFSLDDPFFHIKFAEILREKGPAAITDFDSIYFSKMGIGQEYLVYYNFLFYLALIPFTFMAPLVVGMKLYGVLALATSFTIVYAFLKKTNVAKPFLWSFLFLLVLLQSGWLLRFTLARPFTLAPAFLILMLYFIHRKKYWIIGVISFLFFYWHTATFMFPFFLAFAYFLFEQFYGKKPDWKLVVYPFVGTALSLFVAYLISPGFIAYLKDVIFPVFYDTTLTKATKIVEGGEVYGKNFFSTLDSFFWLIAGLFTAGVYELFRYVQTKRGLLKQEDVIDMSIQPMRLMLFVASLVFLVGSKISARFLDYFAFFSILYVAIAVGSLVKFFQISGALFKKALWTGVIVVSCFLFVSLSLDWHGSLAGLPSYISSQAPAEWLNTHKEKGDVVFNVDWDSFPTLYYFTGDRFKYITGLEPRFLYDLDPRLYNIWNSIGKGMYCEESECPEYAELGNRALKKDDTRKEWYAKQGELIANAVQNEFKSDVVVLSINRKSLLAIMDNSKRFKKEFMDEENSSYAIYRVIAAENKQ